MTALALEDLCDHASFAPEAIFLDERLPRSLDAIAGLAYSKPLCFAQTLLLRAIRLSPGGLCRSFPFASSSTFVEPSLKMRCALAIEVKRS